MNEFGLPKEHHMLLILSCFFNLGRVKIAGLFLLDFENFSEGAAAKFLNDLEAALEDFLVFLEGHRWWSGGSEVAWVCRNSENSL